MRYISIAKAAKIELAHDARALNEQTKLENTGSPSYLILINGWYLLRVVLLFVPRPLASGFGERFCLVCHVASRIVQAMVRDHILPRDFPAGIDILS